MTAIKDKLHSQYRKAIEEVPPDQTYKVREKGDPRIYNLDEIYEIIKHNHRQQKPGFRLLKGGVRCDDIVVLHIEGYKKTGFYVIERKTNPPLLKILNKIRQQLQGGIQFIEDFIAHNPELHREHFDFLPVLVSKRISNISIKRELLKIKITSPVCVSQRIRHVHTGTHLPEYPMERLKV